MQFFPVDEETLRYLRLTGRSAERIALVEAYCKENALWHDPDEQATVAGRRTRSLDRRAVARRAAAPAGPVPLRDAKQAFVDTLPSFGVDYGNAHDAAVAETFPASDPLATAARARADGRRHRPHGTSIVLAELIAVDVTYEGETFQLDHGAVVIAAIPSCTNTSNPMVMVAAGLLAKKAVERGSRESRWVKSSLAPGSKVVTEYYDKAGLTSRLELVPHRRLRLHHVHRELRAAAGEISSGVSEGDLVVCAVLGNRNFEARIHAEVKANYLASPPLVVAYALAGRMDIDLRRSPSGRIRRRGCSWRTSGRRPRRFVTRSRRPSARRCSARPMRTSSRATPRGAASRPRASSSPGIRLHLRAPAHVLRRDAARAGHRRRRRAGARCLVDRRLGDHGPHLTCRLHQAGLAGRPLPRRARRRAQGLQLVRVAARQP